MPRLRVVARKHSARHRGGAEEYRVTLTFQWPNGHTMSFVANDTVSAARMHRTLLPALQNAFPINVRGVPPIHSVDHRAIMATPIRIRAVADTVGAGMPDE